MELLERYIQAVKKRLPWDRQDDIAAELRVNLQAQLEDREAELGRPLSDAEADAWIRQLGSPRHTADQYRPVRYLIGPELYSNYVLVLGIVLGWTLALSLFFGIVAVAGVYPHIGWAILGVGRQVSGALFTNAAVVTIVFAAIEFARAHKRGNVPAASESGWTPRDLPALEPAGGEGAKPRSWGRVIAGLVVGCMGLGWLAALPFFPYLIIGPGASYLSSFPFAATPALKVVYWLVVGQLALAVVWRIVTLFTGSWRQRSSAERLVFRLMGLAPIVAALAAPRHEYVRLENPGAAPGTYAAQLPMLNELFYRLVLLFLAIGMLQLAWQLVRAITAHYRRTAARNPSPGWQPHS